MQKQLLILESKYRTNTQDTNGSEYKFKLKSNVNINGTVRLEQFIFQNSQYTFSADKKSDKFVFTSNTGIPTTITIQGKFDTIDDFVKRFNILTAGLNITMIYTSYLYEIKITHTQGLNFSLSEYYDDGTFMSLIGYNKVNQGLNTYTNNDTPKLFSQNLIYITIPELGCYNVTTKDSRPFTFAVLSQQGFEVVANINNTFANSFYVSNKNLDELTVRICSSDGLSFINNKGNANFVMILSY